ncbi:lysine N(6)-hydroxylase/L-ornithine N(5)-oxygenase family protein [Amycolatopsis panacis]|uniref:L-lysine N6-monooxygenase MbtG n=1 Tax=Amycolatopsis panacis TaxID=2340917 RepID=A0A419HJR0_9PSEU|nr:SidA/IucD/PvdA family monooxygenase [Amycolatopsis panacis]RJQ75880.1 L-lysine 6-monooxygenase [Amycolatopsis panacis]
MTYERQAEVLAIGAGPANLSLAALGAPLARPEISVVESRASVSWHPGLLLNGSRLQVSGVKDLVSLVDPRSRYSFLNFLSEQGRLYRHLIASGGTVSRKEFDQYFRWAATELGVHLNQHVKSVEHDGAGFLVHSSQSRWRVKDLVLGVGQRPYLPPCAREVRGGRVTHAARFHQEVASLAGQEVLLVGGGQSAGEVALEVLSGRAGHPRGLTWITAGDGLTPLDESPFSTEWAHPRYVEHFRQLPVDRRRSLLRGQRPAQTGISGHLLGEIYRRLYELDYLDKHPIRHGLHPHCELVRLTTTSTGRYRAAVRDRTADSWHEFEADHVILATGFRPEVPDFLSPLLERLPITDGVYHVDEDYSLGWDGPPGNRIYVQNAAQGSHGIADPNLSLAAWRSAVILNSLTGRESYRLPRADITLALDW